jgi:phospholipid/cholesterol/gamma-HCH transport system substrate-binding protein
MENRAYAFAVGLFTLLLGAGVVLVALWLSGQTEKRVSYMLESRHPVTGLNVQAPVRYRGIDVGKVETIGFTPKDPRTILIRVAVRSDTPITRGTYAQLGSQGVTGLAYVILDDDGTKPERVAVGDLNVHIPVRPSFLDELSGSGKDLVTDVRQVAGRVNVLLNEANQAQLMRTLAGLEGATNRVSELAVKVDPALRNMPALTDDARKTLARADELMVNLSKLTLELAKRVDTLERVAKSAEQVGEAAQRMGGAAHSVSGTAVGETMPRIHALLEELAHYSRNLDRLLADLNEQPSTLVFGRPAAAPGPGEPGFNPRRGASK